MPRDKMKNGIDDKDDAHKHRLSQAEALIEQYRKQKQDAATDDETRDREIHETGRNRDGETEGEADDG